MSDSWKVDPSSGDYVIENGVPVVSHSLIYPAYYRMRISRSQWLYAPDANYGSDYYLVKKRAGLGSNNGLTSIGQKALQPLVDDGRASAVTVDLETSIKTSRGNGVFQIAIEDSQGNIQELNLPQIGV